MSKKKILMVVGCLLFAVISFVVIYHATKKISLSEEYYEKQEDYEVNEEITGEDLEKIKDKTFVLYVSGSNPNSSQIREMLVNIEKKYNTQFLVISFAEFKGTSYYPDIKYSSSILILKKGEVVASLDLLDENNKDIFESEESLEKWLKGKIYL